MNDKKCHNCKSSIEKQKKFCSRDCYAEYRSKEYSGKSHPNYTEKEQITCKNCGESFKVKKYKDKKFCCKKCSEKYMTGENHPNYKENSSVKVKCENCSKTFQKGVYKAENHEKHFCDMKCKSEHMKGRTTDETPSWVSGAKTYRGAKWQKKRQDILERDDYKCQKCGVSNEFYKENKGFGLDIHHIENFHNFESYEDANRSENLICLCRSCHIEEEMSDGSTL